MRRLHGAVDGEAARSCSTMVGGVVGKKIVTIEGVEGRIAEAVKKAWRDLDVVQCGYCQSGQIMAAITLLSQEEANRRRYRCQHGRQHLPLRHLSAHSRGDPRRCPVTGLNRSAQMTTKSETSRSTSVSRRQFVRPAHPDRCVTCRSVAGPWRRGRHRP